MTSSSPRWSTLSVRPLLPCLLLLIPVCLLSAFYVDRPLALWLKEAAHGPILQIFKIITQFGLAEWWLGGSVLLCFYAWRKLRVCEDERVWRLWRSRFQGSALVLASSLASGLVVLVLKVGFGRARPTELFSSGLYGLFPPGLHREFQSFPSGHSQSAFAALVAVGIAVPRLQIPCWAAAVLIAFSRVVTTVHYLSDTMMGAFIGTAGAILVARWLGRRLGR